MAQLKVSDFTLAVRELQQSGLVKEQRDGELISLTPNTGADQIVKLLVQRDISVFEVAVAEQTLETFYLSLMSVERSKSE